jgi:hypothetical protein
LTGSWESTTPGQSGRSVRLVRFKVGHLGLMSDPKSVMGVMERAANAPK